MLADFKDFKSISYRNVIVANKTIAFTTFHLLFLNLMPLDSRIKLNRLHFKARYGGSFQLVMVWKVQGMVEPGNIIFSISRVKRKAQAEAHIAGIINVRPMVC